MAAILADIGGDGRLFIGEDKTLRFPAADLAGASLLFDVRVHDASPTFIVEKVPDFVWPWAIVTLTPTDTRKFRPKVYRYSLKRMDEDAETIVYYGDFSLERATVG